MAGAGPAPGGGGLRRAADGRPPRRRGPRRGPPLGGAAAAAPDPALGPPASCQAGVREPVHVAADAATLNLLAPGRRAARPVGAGRAPREWADIGRQAASPPERAGRLAEFAEAVAGLGPGARHPGHTWRLERDARPARRRPRQPRPGRCRPAGAARSAWSSAACSGAAARRADMVGLAGLGRTLPDGHQREVRWSAADLRGQLDLIRAEASRARSRRPRPGGARAGRQGHRRPRRRPAQVGAEIPSASAEDLDRTPFLLIGSLEQLAAQLRRQAGSWA